MGASWESKVNDAILPRRTLARFGAHGTAGATAGNYGIFFTADDPVGDGKAVYQVVKVTERHETAGTDAGAVTVMLKKVPSGTAPSAGTDMLSAGINLKAAANTNQAGALSATLANLQLSAGDSLAVVTTGVLTSVAGVNLMVELKRVG